VSGELTDAMRAQLAALPRVLRVEPSGRADDPGVFIIPEPGADIAADVRRLLADSAVPITELRIERGRLDGVFRDITQQAA
jgi:hypothetical protein